MRISTEGPGTNVDNAGIVILTTNQIANFDIAVQSRVHIAIKYQPLSKDQTKDIFMNFLEPLNKEGLVDDMGAITEWLEEDVVDKGLDGRQVRNIVTSALTLARAKGAGRVGKGQLKTIFRNVNDFKTEHAVKYEHYKNEQSMRG